MTLAPFGRRIADAVAARGPLCVGIDPHASLLLDWGLSDDVASCERFARTVAEQVAPLVSMVKPQSAFFERFGSRGVAVLETTIAECRAAGAQVLLDVKRGDIGSTSQAYADAYLDQSSPLASDAITASPYLGLGSLTPMFDTARRHGAGVFVLALTSNKEATAVQLATTSDGRAVGHEVLDELRRLNADEAAQGTWGSFGAVVGATVDPGAADFAIDGPILAPGFGAQGGAVSDLDRIFAGSRPLVLPSSSREILRAGPDGLAEATRRTQAALALTAAPAGDS